MKAVWVVAVAVAIGAVSTGCGEHTGQSAETETPAAQVADMPPLPEWAPENPSPEFLRAARVLKPYTLDMLRERARRYDSSGPELAAQTARTIRILTASYELFGTLDDSQIEHFVKVKEVRIPVKALTPSQRAAFEKHIQVFQEVKNYDILVGKLYKNGATEDLSNVAIGFKDGDAGPGVMVQLNFWIRQRNGTIKEDNTGLFAFM